MGQVSSVRWMDDEYDQKSDDITCIPQDSLSGEEGMSEEEKSRRRAERRKAKRMRQRERRRQEREERREDADQEEEEGPELLGSDSDEEEEESVALPPSNKQAPPLATTGNRSNKRRSVVRLPEEEPEWDVSSAFVANAASHIRPRGRSRAEQLSRHNKENQARTSQVETTDPAKQRGASLTEQGIKLFKQRKYSQAMSMFTAAIDCDPRDHRFFGNRSYCYWFLELYPLALADAQKSIQLAPDWPKGHFRRGSALMGLMRFEEAEKAMQEVLRLDEKCEEASSKLFNCRVLQLMDLGFEEEQSVILLEKFSTVQAALASPEATGVSRCHTSPPNYTGSPCPSLWVGNVTLDLTETHIRNLFKTYGDIESVRVLHERFCAFVNFRNANMAAKALEKLQVRQGVELENTRLVIRYPDRWMPRTNPGLNTTSTRTSSLASGHLAPVNGDQCFFWRTNGCINGDRCRYKHIPDQQGRDKKP